MTLKMQKSKKETVSFCKIYSIFPKIAYQRSHIGNNGLCKMLVNTDFQYISHHFV